MTILSSIFDTYITAGFTISDRRQELSGKALRDIVDGIVNEYSTCGIGAGSRVGIWSRNSVSYVVSYLALLKLQAVPFLLDHELTWMELKVLFRSCGIQFLLHESDMHNITCLGVSFSQNGLDVIGTDCKTWEDSPDLHPSTEVCRFTSGTSGVPNCIEFSGSAVVNAAEGWCAGTGLNRSDRILCYASLSNGLAFNTSLLPAVLKGCRLHVSSALPTARSVEHNVRMRQPTWIVGFPALFDSLARSAIDPYAFRTVKRLVSSSAPLSVKTSQRVLDVVGVGISNYYGIAEAGPVTFSFPHSIGNGDLGKSLPGVSIKAGSLTKPGRVAVKTNSMGTRYLNAPGLFESRLDASGHFVTEDMGALDGGRLILHGRRTDVINVGGRKISASEVEAALLAIPEITESAVFGLEVGDDISLCAAITDPVAITDAEIRSRLQDLIAPYKIPSRIFRTTKIPRTSTGKLNRAALFWTLDLVDTERKHNESQ